MSPPAAPAACANCGAEIPRGARACPECGADERTGWREQSIYDGLDLPDGEPESLDRSKLGASRAWRYVGIGLILIFVLLAVRGWW